MWPTKQMLSPTLARVSKRLHYRFDVILTCVRWYVAYGPSLGQPFGLKPDFSPRLLALQGQPNTNLQAIPT
jgi:hypothetical protein